VKRARLALEKNNFCSGLRFAGQRFSGRQREMRLSMLRAAIENESGFLVDECELNRPTTSYTIDTIEEIRGAKLTPEIYYLIGEDNLSGLASWHRFEQLPKDGPLCRSRSHRDANESPYQVVHRRSTSPYGDQKRELASGRSIRYLVPPAVE